jgi:Fic family protein
LIHLLTSLREKEISRLESGESSAPGEQLFDRSVFKEALSIVSDTRYNQNLIAEYPDLKAILAELNGEKTEQTAESLAELWAMDPDQALAQAFKLVEMGFFERAEGSQTFWVPFLFRDALSMSQGLAE